MAGGGSIEGDEHERDVPLRLELANTSYGSKNGQSNLLAIGDDAGDAREVT